RPAKSRRHDQLGCGWHRRTGRRTALGAAHLRLLAAGTAHHVRLGLRPEGHPADEGTVELRAAEPGDGEELPRKLTGVGYGNFGTRFISMRLEAKWNRPPVRTISSW